jgi:xanthine dehydrogenase YagS FAD-binding subunit
MMRPFVYLRADTASEAAQAARPDPSSVEPLVDARVQFVAGGTTLLDLMKLDVMRPQILVDINPLARTGSDAIVATASGVRFSALTRMADAAEHPLVRRDYPVIADTLRLAASAQLRNMASLGGNLLQRTRCPYFRDTAWAACNKRAPGSGCAALDGVNRQHAVLGTSDECIATYPGDFAQALIALEATIDIVGVDGTRTIPIADLHRPPGRTPNVETILGPGELITTIFVGAGPWTRRSRYLKIRDRESYQFALASAAVALHLDGGVVREVRVALGGVATIPWRAAEAEAVLRGKPLDETAARAAAEVAFAGARARRENAYKIRLGKRVLERALLETARMEV